MAYQHGQKTVKSNKTPAPTQDLKHGGESYGQANAGDTPSSIPPGKTVTTQLGANMRDSVTDDVIDSVIAHGTGKDGGFQTRDLGDRGKVGVHPGCSGASKGAQVPDKIGASQGEPVRRP
jgi:hypothetical protein